MHTVHPSDFLCVVLLFFLNHSSVLRPACNRLSFHLLLNLESLKSTFSLLLFLNQKLNHSSIRSPSFTPEHILSFLIHDSSHPQQLESTSGSSNGSDSLLMGVSRVLNHILQRKESNLTWLFSVTFLSVSVTIKSIYHPVIAHLSSVYPSFLHVSSISCLILPLLSLYSILTLWLMNN